MIVLALRGIVERRLRAALTAIAVLLGVAMIAGTYVQTDQIRTAFENIEQTAYAGVDVVVTPRTDFTSGFSSVETMPQDVVRRVSAVPGVARAEGTLTETGSLVVRGKVVDAGMAPTAVFARQTGSFDPFKAVAGRKPLRSGEVAIDRQLAEDQDVRVGDRVGVTTRHGVAPVRVVGIVQYGDVASIGGAQLIVATLGDMQRWYDRTGRVTEVAVAAAGGVTPERLAARVRAALPSTVEVKTGQRTARDTANDINDAIGGFLTPALLALAGASVLVGGFIIFNTFSITVAQRTRELAVLRALGATRRQVLGAVVTEALLIGATASLLGLLGGLGIARLLGALFDAAGMGIPRGAMELAPRTIAVGLAVGLGVTLVATLAPALRATRVTPVAAMADVPPPAPRGRRRAVAALCVLGLGVAALAQGLFGGGTATTRLGAMGAGTMLVFVGVALTSRLFIGPLARLVGWPIERLAPATGELARENAALNPSRTATTAAALTVGLGLVVFVAVFASSLKASFTGSLDRLVTADLVVSTDQGTTPLPARAEGRIAAVPGVAATTALRIDAVRVNGERNDAMTDVLTGVDPTVLPRMYRFDWVDGSQAAAHALGPGTALIEEQFARAHHIGVGDRFTVATPTGRRTRLRALGVYRDPQILQGVIVTEGTFASVSSVTDAMAFLVRFAPGADAAATQARVERAIHAYPTAKARNMDQYRAELEDQLDRIASLLYALLAMSVVISLFGIANSLFLAVHQRTRELGVLRAVGATAGQVRRLIRYESVITAVIGGTLGTAVGLAFAFLTVLALDDWGLALHVPVGQLVLFLVLAVLAGVVGAVAPARRASRVDVVRAVGAGE